MRLLLALVAVLATTLVAARHEYRAIHPVDVAPRFAASKMYVFDWESQLATGLSGQQQNALQRVSAQLRLHFVSEKTAVAELKEIQLAHLNEELPEKVTKLMPLKALKPSKLREDQLEKLRMPFEIRYEQGRIAGLIFEQKDQPWSENLKRSAVQSLQIQLDTDEKGAAFRTNETNAEGECEVVYSIIPRTKCEHTAHLQNVLGEEIKPSKQCTRVTSSINFDRCSRLPELRYNFYRSEVPSAEQPDQQAIEKSTTAEVEMLQRAGKSHYLPIWTRVLSHYSVPVSRANQIRMLGVVVSELKLREERSLIAPPEVQAKKPLASLLYSTEFDEQREEFLETGAEAYLSAQPYLRQMNIPDVVLNVARRLSQTFVADKTNHWQLDSEAAHQFTNLVKMLRYASQKDLERINKQVCEGAELQGDHAQKEFIKELMIDALALAGTHPTSMHLLKKIETKQITKAKAVAAIRKLAKNTPFVGQELLRAVWKVCELPAVGSAEQRSCVLSWSRMANVMCGVNQKADQMGGDEWTMHKRQNAHCGPDVRAEITKNLEKLMKQGETDTEQKILALKACGNAAVLTVLPLVEQIINEPTEERLVRVIALDALRQLAEHAPEKTQPLLLPVIMNRREYPEVRMNALHQLLKSRPTKSVIDQVAAEMIREPNANMKTFAISAFKNAAKSIMMVEPKCAEYMKDAVALLRNTLSPEQEEKLQRANSRYMSFGLPQEAGFLSGAWLNSNDSYLPKEVMVQLDALVGEHFLPVFAQFGIHQQNVEQLMAKLVSKLEDKQLKEVFTRGKRSTLSSLVHNPGQLLKNVYEQLRIRARRNPHEKPQLMVYQRAQNMDVAYGLLNEEHLPQMVKDLFTNGQIDLSAIETNGERSAHFIQGDFTLEQRVKIPTSFGVSMLYSAHLCHVSNVHAQAKIELESAEKQQIKAGKAQLQFTGKLSALLVHKLEAFSPLFTVGVQTQHNLDGQLPLKLSIQYDTESKKGLIVDLELPQNAEHIHKFVQVSSHPATLYRQWPEQSRVYVEHQEQTLLMPQLEQAYRQVDMEHTCQLSGLKAEIRGHYHKCQSANVLDVANQYDCWMIGENALEIHAHASDRSAKKLRMVFRLEEQQASKQLKASQGSNIKMMFLQDEKKVQELFANAQPNEIQTLKEFAERAVSSAATAATPVYKFVAEAHALDINGKSQRHLQTVLKSTCDREMITCTVEADAQASESKSYCRLMAQLARPTVSGVYGAVRSTHILSHVELEWGNPEQKNIMSGCVYGRPSKLAVHQFNQLMNIKSEDRITKQEQYGSMEEEDYEEMVIRQMPARLYPNRFSFAIEQQLNPATTKSMSRFLNYILIAYNPWKALTRQIENAEHKRLIAEVSVEPSGYVQVQMNDLTHETQLPSLTADLIESQEWQTEHERIQQEINSQESGENKENNDESMKQTRSQRRILRQFTGETNFYSCSLKQGNMLKMFTGETIKATMSRCYTVISQDCELEPQFAVMVRRNEQNDPETFELKLLQPKSVIEMYLENERVVVRINKKIMREDELAEHYIQKVTTPSGEYYRLNCPKTGLIVTYSGTILNLRVPESLINRQCGMCGTNNGEYQAKLVRKADNTLTHSLKSYHASYLLRDEGCTAAEVQNFEKRDEQEYRWADQANESEQQDSTELKTPEEQMMEQEQKKTQKDYEGDSSVEEKKNKKSLRVAPRPATRVIQHGNLICFSLMPHNECPRGTVPVMDSEELKELEAQEDQLANEELATAGNEFACWNRHAPKTQEMLRRVRKEGVVDELKGATGNKFLSVQVPKRCARVQVGGQQDFL